MVEPNRIMLTEGEQHWRKQVVTFFGCLLNVLLAAAGVGLAVTLGTKAADSKSLIAPLIWASIQAYAPSTPFCKPGLLLPPRDSQTDCLQATGAFNSCLRCRQELSGGQGPSRLNSSRRCTILHAQGACIMM